MQLLAGTIPLRSHQTRGTHHEQPSKQHGEADLSMKVALSTLLYRHDNRQPNGEPVFFRAHYAKTSLP